MFSSVAFLLIGLFGTTQCFMLYDECTAYPKHSESGTTEITVKTSCRNGTIDWNYPSGNVIVHFPFGASFSVCIVDGILGDVLTPIDTSGRCYKVLPAISSAPICVDAIGGKADITLQAPQTKYYMASVDYYVSSPSGLRC